MQKIKSFCVENEFFLIYLYILILSLRLLLLGYGWSWYFFLLILGFGLGNIFWGKKFGLVANVLVGFLVSSAFLVVSGAISDFIGLGITRTFVILFLMFSLIFLFINYGAFKFVRKDFRVEFYDVFALIIVIIALWSKVFSVSSYFAPICHDPIAHSEWARGIVETGRIEYFYSPGLHILAAIGELVGSYNVAKQTLILTNVFNAIIGVPIYLFIRKVYKNPLWAIMALVMFSLGAYPALFFKNAGKNALISALPYVFLVLLPFTFTHLKKTYGIVISNILYFTLVLFHYPAAFIGSLFIGAYYLLNIRNILKNLMFYFPAILVSIIWGCVKFGYELERRKGLRVSTQNNNVVIEYDWDRFRYVLTSFWDKIESKITTGDLGVYVLVLGLIGIGVFFLASRTSKKLRSFALGTVLFLLSAFVIEFFFLKSVRIIYATEILVTFLFFYLFSTYTIADVIIPHVQRYWKNIEKFLIIFLLIISLFVGKELYSGYSSQQEKLNLVTETDLVVYDWIEANISSDDKILNNAIITDRKDVVFQTDGGAWIPVYTSRDIAMPFSEFALESTHSTYALYKELHDDPGNCEAIEALKNMNINYYYHANRPVFGPSLVIPEELLSSGVYKKLLHVENAVLYKIVGCD